MERNTNNSVRERIDRIVDQQEMEITTPEPTKEKRRRRFKLNFKLSRKVLTAIVSGVFALAAVLIVVIIVVAVQSNNYSDEDKAQDSTVVTQTDKLLAEIDEQIEELGNENDIIDLYQEYIDKTEGEERAAILMARITQVMSVDIEQIYGDLVIADAIAVDDILKTADSAGTVINAASSYNKTDVVSEYLEILNGRARSDDEEMETIG